MVPKELQELIIIREIIENQRIQDENACKENVTGTERIQKEGCGALEIALAVGETAIRHEMHYNPQGNITAIVTTSESPKSAHEEIEYLVDTVSPNDILKIIKDVCKKKIEIDFYCKKNKNIVYELVLKKYQVDYTDKSCFINVMENESPPRRGNAGYHDNNSIDLEKPFQLFLKYYNMSEITCPENVGITSIPVLPLLKKLICNNNPVTSLPEGLQNLRQLEITNNRLRSIPVFENLVVLKCGGNQLKSLPVFPNLKTLICNNNYINFLPVMLNLGEVNCSKNLLTSFPLLPLLKYLNCNENYLTSLPILTRLVVLYCKYNKILFLPNAALLRHLKKLICTCNQLEQIPAYLNLKTLDCGGNQLSSLPVFPQLTSIRFDGNLITSVEVPPETTICSDEDLMLKTESTGVDVKVLDKDDPRLTSIPEVIEKMSQTTQVDDEPALECNIGKSVGGLPGVIECGKSQVSSQDSDLEPGWEADI